MSPNSRRLLSALALASVAAASPCKPTDVCAAVTKVISALQLSPEATAFCLDLLAVPTLTSTVTVTSTPAVVDVSSTVVETVLTTEVVDQASMSVSTATETTTETEVATLASTSTAVESFATTVTSVALETSTSIATDTFTTFSSVTFAFQPPIRRTATALEPPPNSTPSCVASFPATDLSKACSCLSLTTPTVTVSSTTILSTVTSVAAVTSVSEVTSTVTSLEIDGVTVTVPWTAALSSTTVSVAGVTSDVTSTATVVTTSEVPAVSTVDVTTTVLSTTTPAACTPTNVIQNGNFNNLLNSWQSSAPEGGQSLRPASSCGISNYCLQISVTPGAGSTSFWQTANTVAGQAYSFSFMYEVAQNSGLPLMICTLSSGPSTTRINVNLLAPRGVWQSQAELFVASASTTTLTCSVQDTKTLLVGLANFSLEAQCTAVE